MDVLDISPLIVWVIAGGQLLTFGLTVWGLMSSGTRRNTERLSSHAQRLSDHAQRLASLEQAQGSLPTRDDLHALHLGVAEMRGDLREMRAVMDGSRQIMGRLEAIVSRHEDFLLDGAKR